MGLVITSQKEFLIEEDLRIKLNHAFSLICNENKRAIIPANTTIFAAPIINIRLFITSAFLIPELDLIILLY